MRPEPAIESLRAQIEKIEGRSRRAKSVLPFGIAEVDSRLPGGGLALGALHEIAGGGNGRRRSTRTCDWSRKSGWVCAATVGGVVKSSDLAGERTTIMAWTTARERVGISPPHGIGAAIC